MTSALSKYAKWYLDAHPDADAGALFMDQNRKFATELYTQTAAVAPSVSEIASDVRAQGWKIPAFFGDVVRDEHGRIISGGRIGRGLARMWGDFALQRREKRKRGRPTQGAIEERQQFLAKRPTLAQMQAFVIAVRSRARLFLASGWLGAVVDLKGTLSTRSGDVDPDRGGARVTVNGSVMTAELWNRTQGIEEQAAKHQIVEKATAVRVADMWVYVRRKMDEAARMFLKAA